MSDIYQAPQSELTEQRDATDIDAALERAAAGDFEFRPVAIIKESWELIKGAKLPILLGVVALYVVSFIVQIGGALVWSPDANNLGYVFLRTMTIAVVQMVATAPFWGGLLYMGIQRAAGNPVSLNDIGSQFHRAGTLIATTLLSAVMIYVGLILFILPGIYLMVAYLLALPLVVDKGLGPVQALEASRKALSRCWFRMFWMMFLMGLIMVISMLPIFIGLIWTIPLWVVVFGVAYRHIFGISTASDDAARTL